MRRGSGLIFLPRQENKNEVLRHPQINAGEKQDCKPPIGIAAAPSRCRSLWLRLATLASVKESGSGTNPKPPSHREDEIERMHIEENI